MGSVIEEHRGEQGLGLRQKDGLQHKQRQRINAMSSQVNSRRRHILGYHLHGVRGSEHRPCPRVVFALAGAVVSDCA